jgi:RND superfamily putative drug exporter
MFTRIADLTWQRPKLVLTVVGVFVLVAFAFGGRVEEYLKPAGFNDPSSESKRAQDLLIAQSGHDGVPAIVVLVRPRSDGARLALGAPGTRRELARLARELRSIPGVARVDAPLAGARSGLVARDRGSALLTAYLVSGDEEIAGDAAEAAEQRLRSKTLDVEVGGYAAGFNEVNDTTRSDLIRAELIAFPVLALLLLIVFRGVVAAGIPLLVGGLSVAGTFLALRVMSEFVDTSIFALNISTALGLGLAVDYGLLLVSRYREELERHGAATREAHRRVVETAGRTVMYSGMTVAVAMAALVLMPQRFLYSMGAGGAFVAAFAALGALFLVPALLALLGERVNALSLRRGPAVSDESGGWYRLARGVMRRPVPIALGSAAIMLVLALPLLSIDLTGPSPDIIPRGKPSRVVSETVKRDYPRGLETPIAVTVAGAASAAELKRLDAQIASIDGIATATPFRRLSPHVAQASFGASDATLADRSQDAVREIRSLHAPAPLLVSGNTAEFLDLKQSLRETAPVVVGLIALTTLVLLFMLTGSVVLPLKTLLMNVLTLAATLGVVVAAFEWGILDGPLDYFGPSATETSMIVVLFAVTFGLATDYAVLVLARIKELHDSGLPNEEAVAQGIARTGRVITAAAVCLAAVFLAFTTSSVFFMKQIGVGQSAAVLIDATIVRALLVPALMRLLGDWNWWAPSPLRRFQRRFGFSEA